MYFFVLFKHVPQWTLGIPSVFSISDSKGVRWSGGYFRCNRDGYVQANCPPQTARRDLLLAMGNWHPLLKLILLCVADSCWYLAKPIQNCKVKKKKLFSPVLAWIVFFLATLVQDATGRSTGLLLIIDNRCHLTIRTTHKQNPRTRWLHQWITPNVLRKININLSSKLFQKMEEDRTLYTHPLRTEISGYQTHTMTLQEKLQINIT